MSSHGATVINLIYFVWVNDLPTKTEVEGSSHLNSTHFGLFNSTVQSIAGMKSQSGVLIHVCVCRYVCFV